MNVSWNGSELKPKSRCFWVGPEQTGDMFLSLLVSMTCACNQISTVTGMSIFYSFVNTVVKPQLQELTPEELNNPFEVTLFVWEILRNNLVCSRRPGVLGRQYQFATGANNFLMDLIVEKGPRRKPQGVNCAGGSTLLVHTVLSLRPDWKDKIGYVMKPQHVYVWALDTVGNRPRGIETTEKDQYDLIKELTPEEHLLPYWVGDMILFSQIYPRTCEPGQFEHLLTDKITGAHAFEWQLIIDLLKVMPQKAPVIIEKAIAVYHHLFLENDHWRGYLEDMLNDIGTHKFGNLWSVVQLETKDRDKVERLLKYLESDDTIPVIPPRIASYRNSCKSAFRIAKLFGKVSANASIGEACHSNDCNYIAKFVAINDEQSQTELEALIRIQDLPVAPKVYDVFLCQDVLIFIFERLDGTLIDYVLQGKPLDGVKQQLENLVGALHSVGIVHQDLIPANVMYKGDRFYLIDFGQALLTGATGEDYQDDEYMIQRIFDEEIPYIKQMAKRARQGTVDLNDVPLWLQSTIARIQNK
jgi:hypothetical protein